MLSQLVHKKMSSYNYPFVEVDNTIDVKKEDNVDILNIIFGVDPKTKLPRNDLGLLQSKDTNPEIVAFIQKELLKPREVVGETSGQFSELDDDTLLEYSRKPHESTIDWAYRLKDKVVQNVMYMRQQQKVLENENKSDS